MRLLYAILLAITMGCSPSNQDATPSPLDLSSTGYKIVSRKAELPSKVLEFLETQLPKNDKGGIADREEPFQATDAVKEEGRPQRQFRFAGIAEMERYLIVYRHGGRGVYYCFLIIESNNNSFKVLFSGLSAVEIESLEQFRKVVREKTYEEVDWSTKDPRF